MAFSIGEIRPGISLIYNDELYLVNSCEHAKLARGSAFSRVKLKNMKTGQVIDATLRDSDKVVQAYIDKRSLQYLYCEGNIYHFLDMETYEDLVLDKARIEDSVCWLKDNLVVEGMFYDNELISVDFPKIVELKVISTEPGVKGDTAKQVTKPATLETGLIINVPLFINQDEVIKVDTVKKEYVGRT